MLRQGNLQNPLIDQMISALTARAIPVANPTMFLLNARWPAADWTLSGAFRHESLLHQFHELFMTNFGLGVFARVSGAPSCSWNSDRDAPAGLMPLAKVAEIIHGYTANGIAVQATFANPELSQAHLADPLGNAVLDILSQNQGNGRNGVIVSSEALARHIRHRHPGLMLVVSEIKTARDGGQNRADHYRRLTESYERVTIHPEDNLDGPLMEALENKDRCEIVVNDPCWRGCALRPAHDQLLAALALAPQDFVAREREQALIRQAGCLNLPAPLFNAARRPLYLSSEELQRLYDMGYRHFRMLPALGHSPCLFQFEMAKWLLNHDQEHDYIPTRLMQCSLG